MKGQLILTIFMIYAQYSVAQVDYSLNLKAGLNRPLHTSSSEYVTDFTNHTGSNYTLGFTISKKNFLLFTDIELISLGFSEKYKLRPFDPNIDFIYPSESDYRAKYLGFVGGGGYKLLNKDKNELTIKVGFGYYLLGWRLDMHTVTGADGEEEQFETYSDGPFEKSFVSVPLFITYLHNFTEHIGVSLETGMNYNISIFKSNYINENPVLPKANIGFHFKL